MNTNSNSYTITYASVVVVIVAFLLTLASSPLEATQDKNQEPDTKRQTLAVLNIRDVRDADAKYNKYVKNGMSMNVDGTLTESVDGFPTSYEKEVRESNRLHVFVCDVDGEAKYVVLVYDIDLWGTIWGHTTLNADKDAVYDVYLSHASEAPGLGTEITTTAFQGEFSSKKVSKNGQVVLAVKENGRAIDPTYQVGDVLGGITTSKGADVMIKACLSQYDKFLTNS